MSDALRTTLSDLNAILGRINRGADLRRSPAGLECYVYGNLSLLEPQGHYIAVEVNSPSDEFAAEGYGKTPEAALADLDAALDLAPADPPATEVDDDPPPGGVDEWDYRKLDGTEQDCLTGIDDEDRS